MVGLQAVAAVAEKAVMLCVAVGVQHQTDFIRAGEQGVGESFEQGGVVVALAQHAVQIGQPFCVFFQRKLELAQEVLDLLVRPLADELLEGRAGVGQVAAERPAQVER